MFSRNSDLATAVPAARPAAAHRGACCCLHVGMPKTATTMLQLHLFPEHSQIWYLGKFACQRNKFPDEEIQAVIADLGSRRPSGMEQVRKSLRERAARALADGRVPVWSKEGMTGGSPEKKRQQAQLLRQAFGSCKVIITVREPLSFVESLYFQQLRAFQFKRPDHDRRRLGRAPRYFDINQWLDVHGKARSENVLGQVKFGETAEICADVFGKEQVGIFVFEELKASPGAFIRRLCEFIGIDAEEGQRLTADKHANTRLRQDTVDRLKAIQGSFRSVLRYRWATQPERKQMLGLDESEGLPAGPVARAELSPAWRERIRDLGRRQVEKLLVRWDLPLERYGYPI